MTHLLIYGDSNTYGARPRTAPEGDPGRVAQPWPAVLAAGLGEGWRVTVEGLPGRTTTLDDPVEGAWRNGLTVLPAILHSHTPIDLVAIMLGTNDLKARFAATAPDVAQGVMRVAREAGAQLPGTRVLVICPPLPSDGEIYGDAARRGAGLPGHLARLAAAAGAAFFDAGRVITVDPADGIHFEGAAHAALGQALIPVMQGLR